MKKYLVSIIIVLLQSTAFPVLLDDIQLKQLTVDRLKQYPVTSDGRNYFFLQSVENKTQIVIGDFSQNDRQRIILITLDSDYNTIQSVVEYDPQKKTIRRRKESDSKLFTADISKLKKDIINGAIYYSNHADKMKSYGELEQVFKKGETANVFPDVFGFNVKLAEVDDNFTPLALFSFGKSGSGYYMQFRTDNYRISAGGLAKPVLRYSVYCKDTNDPVIKEIVDNLFKIREPSINKKK